MKKYLGIDIGGTFIKYGIVGENGQVIKKEKEKTITNPEVFLENLINRIKEFIKKENIDGIGISMAGFINVETGENDDFSVSEIFTKYNLKKIIGKEVGKNVSVENDANCAILAEKWIGNGQGVKDFVVVTFGTGIGGAIIINDKLVRGGNFRAGEFGIMNIGEREDGTFKNAEATTPLVKKVSRVIKKEIEGEFIFENLDKDIVIKEIYDKWIKDIVKVVSNVVIILDPKKLLIGGGVSEQERFINDLKMEMYKNYPYLEEGLDIETCKLKNDAGIIGAIYNYMEEYEKSYD